MFVVALGGTLLSLAGGYLTGHLQAQIHRKEFEKGASERFEAINNRLSRYLGVAEDLSGLFAASQQVDRDEFATYVQPILKRLKGLHSLTWNRRVLAAQRQAFETETAREFPGFRITEQSNTGALVPAVLRDEAIVIDYVEPFSAHDKEFGFDVASDPVRLASFELARDSGMTTVTPQAMPILEKINQYVVHIIHPIYAKDTTVETVEERRHHLSGFAVGVICFRDLIESAIAGLSPRGITFWLHDISDSGKPVLLYRHLTRLASSDDSPNHPPSTDALHLDRTLTVANRKWLFTALHHHDIQYDAHVFSRGLIIIPLIGFSLTILSLLFLRRLLRNETERLELETALRNGEEQKRIIIEQAPFGIIVADRQGKIQEFNLEAERMFGHARPLILEQCVTDLVPPAFKDAHEAGFRRHLETGKSRILGLPPFETAALHQNGSTFPVRLAVNRIQMKESLTFLAVIIDITEEKRLLTELIQSEKMAALGNMVAGVAHEINTPVGIGITASSDLEDRIRAFALTLRQEGISEEELETFILAAGRMAELIRVNLERAADLIRSFKSVAVDQSCEEMHPFKIRDCVESAIKTLHPELRTTRLEIDIDCPETLEILSHPGAFSQIVINLVNNSRIHGYTPPAEGRITITFKEVGASLHFSYSDDGAGMSDAVVKRIFDPFFTTNRQHGGTGLGMHIVYNLVTQTLGGTIDCHSVPGQGTHFRIQIPLDQGRKTQHLSIGKDPIRTTNRSGT